MSNKISSIKKYETIEREISGENLSNINIFRIINGLKPLIEKKRKCLKCDIFFTSLQFRLCNNCRQYANENASNFDVR